MSYISIYYRYNKLDNKHEYQVDNSLSILNQWV